jgi:hypothetical protein
MSFEAKHILVYALPKELRLVGPFETEADLVEWGKRWQEGNGDDPRWQQVELPEGSPDPILLHVSPPE